MFFFGRIKDTRKFSQYTTRGGASERSGKRTDSWKEAAKEGLPFTQISYSTTFDCHLAWRSQHINRIYIGPNLVLKLNHFILATS